MGGGATATMRAASKVSGITGGVIHSGLRGSAAPAAEQAVRKSSIPVSATLSSSSSSRGGSDVASIQRPAWEIGEWEFAGDDLAGEAVMPRVVFAGVASFDEAKEATVELKDALDKVYLSSTESKDLSGLSLISKSDAENKSNGTITVSNHAMTAFKLLSSSHEARDVVASIASDKNVWNAVMNNPVLQDFIQSNKNNLDFHESLIPEKTEDDNDTSAKQPEAKESGSWFKGMFEKAKLSTVNLVNRLSSKFQEIFVPSDEKEGKNDKSFEISIIGLVTMVVMVVLFKRI